MRVITLCCNLQGQPELAMEMQQIQWPHSYGLTRERVPSTRKAYELHVIAGTDTAYAAALAIVLHDICFRSQVRQPETLKSLLRRCLHGWDATWPARATNPWS